VLRELENLKILTWRDRCVLRLFILVCLIQVADSCATAKRRHRVAFGIGNG